MAIDRQVSCRAILRALAGLRRQGVDRAMQRLEQIEPDLAEFVLEHLSLVYSELVRLGGPPKRTQRVYREIQTLVLSSIEALRQGHYELWREEKAAEPFVADDATPVSPPQEATDEETRSDRTDPPDEPE